MEPSVIKVQNIIKIQNWYRMNRLKSYLNKHHDFFNSLCFLNSKYNCFDCEKFLKQDEAKSIYEGFIKRVEHCFLNKRFYKGNNSDSIVSFYIFSYPETIHNRTNVHCDLVEESTNLVKSFLNLNNSVKKDTKFKDALDDFVCSYVKFNNCYVVCDLISVVEHKKNTFDKIIHLFRTIDIVEKREIFKTDEQKNRGINSINSQIEVNKKILGYTDKDFEELKKEYFDRFLELDFNYKNSDLIIDRLLLKIDDPKKRDSLLQEYRENINNSNFYDFLTNSCVKISDYAVYKKLFELEYKNKYEIKTIKDTAQRKNPK